MGDVKRRYRRNLHASHWDAQVESLYRPGITSLASQHRADRLTDVAELQSAQNKAAAVTAAGTREDQGPKGLTGGPGQTRVQESRETRDQKGPWRTTADQGGKRGPGGTTEERDRKGPGKPWTRAVTSQVQPGKVHLSVRVIR